MGRVEERELFLSTGRSIDLVKSTVPELVINAKLKSVPKAALQSGVYVTDALTVPPPIAPTRTLSMLWVPMLLKKVIRATKFSTLTDIEVGHSSTYDIASPNTDIVVMIRSQLCSREGNIVYFQLSTLMKIFSGIKVTKGYLSTTHWSRLYRKPFHYSE